MKKILFVLAALLMVCGCAHAEDGLRVVATNFVCYDFARQVAGERAEVSLLIHPGVEVHAYEPSPVDILAIGASDLFVYIGGESDAWAEDILSSFDGAEKPQSLRMMDAVTPLEEEGEEESRAHDAPEYDEHIWTSPKNAVAMLQWLADALCALDPDGEAEYRVAADAYIGRVDEIDAAIEEAVAGGVRRELVFADRFPFLYLTRDYGLDYAAAFPSCTADTEPTPQTMLTLIQRVRTDRIPVIYTIELSTQAVARTVAEETGAAIRTMHSMQTVTQEEFDAGESYVSLMLNNVEAIREGLA